MHITLTDEDPAAAVAVRHLAQQKGRLAAAQHGHDVAFLQGVGPEDKVAVAGDGEAAVAGDEGGFVAPFEGVAGEGEGVDGGGDGDV